MKTPFLIAGLVITLGPLWAKSVTVPAGSTNQPLPKIEIIQPPEQDFFAKQLNFCGIPIKAHQVVSDQALYVAYDRLIVLLAKQPVILSNLVAAKVELHIIGKDQVTSDLPEWRQDKGKPLPEFKGLTRDQRSRGMGGRLSSCGEENLLKLEKDKYFGRDICVHEFSHAIRDYGFDDATLANFEKQYQRSLAKGLWTNGYAATNSNEYFAELSMWYFGTHGDLHMNDPKPSNGPEGLKQYDPEAYQLFDDFYSGRLPVSALTPRHYPDDN